MKEDARESPDAGGRQRRRWFQLLALAGLGALPLRQVMAEDDPLLQESDPGARGVAYHADAAKVDPQKNPDYRPGQTCANCALYVGAPGAARGGCGLFFGKDVAARGWCNAWERK